MDIRTECEIWAQAVGDKAGSKREPGMSGRRILEKNSNPPKNTTLYPDDLSSTASFLTNPPFCPPIYLPCLTKTLILRLFDIPFRAYIHSFFPVHHPILPTNPICPSRPFHPHLSGFQLHLRLPIHF